MLATEINHGQTKKRVFNALCRENFYAFVKKAFNETHGSEHFHDSFAIELICDRLEKCMRGEIRKLIINIPPRNLKSFITSVCLPAYLLGKDSQKEIVCVSYSSDLANKLSRDTKSIMEMPFYKDIFATRIGRKNTEDMFETTKHGSRAATTVQGALTGLGGNYLVLDDPCSAADVLSDVKRKNLNDWFQNTFLSRLNDKKEGVMIVIMQRLHEEDLTAILEKQGGWEVLSLPAIAEKDESFVLSDGRIVGRKAGEVLNPEHEPLEILLDLKKAMSEYNFSAQYQQNPIPLKGNIINFDDFKYFENLPTADNRIVVQSWDCAHKTGENNDFSVCVTGAIINNIIYILDISRYRLEFPDLLDEIKDMQCIAHANEVVIEDADIGSGIIQQLEKAGCCPIPFKPEVAKPVRAACVTKLIRDGRVRLLKDAIWLQDFAKEVRAFPYGAHDDQIDALVQLLTEFEKGTFASSSGVYIIDSCFDSYEDDIDDLYQELFDDFKRENPDWS